MLVRGFSLARADLAADAGLPPGTEPLTATLEIHGHLAAPVPAPASAATPGPTAGALAEPLHQRG